jgi:hypothetical protein
MPMKPEKAAAWVREHRARRQAAGLCVDCGEPSSATRCAQCVQKRRARERVSYAAQPRWQRVEAMKLFNDADPLEQRAAAFHLEHPFVFDELSGVALKMKSSGWKRWSINAAFEVVRYQLAIGRRLRIPINNNHRAFYARWLMRDVQALEGFFETRAQVKR